MTLDTVLRRIGLQTPVPQRRVSVIACPRDRSGVHRILMNYERQDLAAKELILVFRQDVSDAEWARTLTASRPDVRIHHERDGRIFFHQPEFRVRQQMPGGIHPRYVDGNKIGYL